MTEQLDNPRERVAASQGPRSAWARCAGAVLLFLAIALPGFAREVRVSYYTYGAVHGKTANGAWSGFGYDVYELLAEKAGWTNRYIGYGRSWGDMEGMIARGETEILDFVRRTPARERVYEFSAQPMSYSYGCVLVRTNETRFAAGGYANWGRVSAGSMTAGCVGGEFRDFARIHGFTVEHRQFRTEEEVLEALRTGLLDMAVVESTFYSDTGEFRMLDALYPSPCYFCTKKGNTALMAEIDRAMAALYEENPAWYTELRHRHFAVKDAVVYLPRTHDGDDVNVAYLKATAYLLAAVGDWNPVFRECAADFSDVDTSVPCIVAHVHRTPENLKKFDFPFVSACRRPICLACAPGDRKFAAGIPKGSGALRIGYDRTSEDCLPCFRDYAVRRGISYTLVPFDSMSLLRKAVLAQDVDLAVAGINPKDGLRNLEECGAVDFDFATPKAQPAFRKTLDRTTRYMRYHEGAFLRNVEKYAYGIADAGRVVRAGVYAELGGIEIGEDGGVSGFVADYLREIARNRNWDLIFVPMTYHEAFACLDAGEVDVVCAANHQPERTDLHDCAERDAGTLRYALKVKAESELLPNRPDLWRGNRIGYLAGSRPVEELEHYLKGIGADHRLVPYTRIQDAVADVRDGRLEGIYTLHARESQDFRTIAVFPSMHAYFFTNRRRPEIRRDIDAAMDYFAGNNIDFNWALNNFHLRGTREVLMLDADEIAYVKRNRGRKIVVGLPETIDPFSRIDERSGEARGLFAMLFREIARKSGLEIDFTNTGKADVYVTQHGYDVGRNDLISEPGWFPLPTVRLSLPANRIPRSALGVWAAEETRTDEIAYLRQNNLRVLVCPTREACYRAVAQGRAEATIDNSGTARLMIDEHREFSALQDSRIDPARWSRQISLAFPPETDSELRSIFVKSRTAISPSSAEKMLVDALVECRQGRFSREDLVHYGVVTGVLVAILLGVGYALMYVKRQHEATQARTRFFFNVSHDIRTPIHAIMGLVDIGLGSLDDRAKVKDCLMKTREAGGLLLALVKSVLDMSRIEAGKVKVEPVPGDVYLSFVNIESTLQELAHEKGIRLTFGFGEIADRFVYADFEVCSRIFVNIITNAIKYTKSGGRVEVECEQVAGRGAETGVYRYTFRDNGVGMSEEFQKRLYDRFSRERNTTLSGVNGLGLGMAICKAFVDILGGRIACASRPGEGTTFTVTLPFRSQQGGSRYVDPISGQVRDKEAERKAGIPATFGRAVAEDADRFRGKRVLLADDSRLNREVACHYLEKVGFEVETAENGQEVVEKVFGDTDGGAEIRFDVVLMDLQMPVMDGFAAARAIRTREAADAGNRRRIPIIAWTANAFDEDREAALAAGMDGHVAKGVKVNVLLEELGKYM